MEQEQGATNVEASPPRVRPLAEDLYRCLALDMWPSNATVTDFGIDSDDHYGALQFAVWNHGLTPEQLDEAMGDGDALTALIQTDNPYHGVKFATAWDGIMKSLKGKIDAPPAEKFPTGRLFATPLALEKLSFDDIAEAFRRHVAKDWGDVDGEDKAANDAAVVDGERVLSSYESKGGVRFWVITEADRSTTTVLLPEEY